MNEKIKELIGQCEIVKYDFEGCLVEAGFDAEKFAELIVEECIGILEPKSRYMGEGPEVLKDKIRQIKQHFGVEE